MARFSVGEEEEEEEEIANRNNRKRRNRTTEDENGNNKLRRVGEPSEEACGSGDIGEICVRIDSDVLECAICCQPLRPPLYQCQNGHVACFHCCTKLHQDKCPTCSHTINFSRCRALEKVIESIRSSCCYSEYGCTRTLPYFEILSHQETCMYAPCFCPMPNCTFSGPPTQVSTHFCANHGGSAISFQYGKQFEVTLKKAQPFVVLHEHHGLLFLLLNDRFVDKGNALSVACIHPNSIEGEFMYEITVSGGASSLQLKASTANIKEWAGIYPKNVFLFVPKDFFTSGEMLLDVCIQRK